MSISKIRNLANIAKKKSSNKLMTSSAQSFLFYGTSGAKSTLSSAQLTDEPILVISPAGGSSHLENEFPNCVYYSIDSLTELEAIIKDLEENMNIIRKVMALDDSERKVYKDKIFVKKYDVKTQQKELDSDWNDILNYANNGIFPFSSVVLEEIDIISSWITDEVEKKFSLEVIGQDKSNLASDWAELRRVLTMFYARLLKLPVRTIFATSDKLPKEQQNLTQITPNICSGAASRILISMIGNVFYVYKDLDKYYVRMQPNQSYLIRSKLAPVRGGIDIPEILDITNNPELFWELVKKCEELREIPKNKKEMDKKIDEKIVAKK